MLTVYICVAALLAIAVTGGRLRRLAVVRLQHVWLLWAALVDQIVIISIIPESHPLVLSVAHVASYLAAGGFVVLNRHLPGILLIGGGGFLNGLVISLNGGTLPASAAALEESGREVSSGQFNNSAVLADPYLPMFGDVFATPSWLPGNNVFSVGDVAIWLGVVLFLWRTCRHRPGHADTTRYLPRHARHRDPAPVHGPAGGRREPVTSIVG